MATKSPGIYFNEIDNTFFTNPKASVPTTLAIVGFAKKGPIGKPVLISSWKEFIDTFGKPVEGYYSGLAVSLFLNAGGPVIFERIADPSIAGRSNYIIKNGRAAISGYQSFSYNNVILNSNKSGYKSNTIYDFSLSIGDQNKKFYVETPPVETNPNGMSQFDILKQLGNQLGQTESRWIGTFDYVPNSSDSDKVYGFKVKNESESTAGNYFINVEASDEKRYIVSKIKDAIKNGTNAICSMEIFKDKEGLTPLVKTTPLGIEGPYGFKISTTGITSEEAVKSTININVESADDIVSIVKKINTALSSYNVISFFDSEKNKIHFISLGTDYKKVLVERLDLNSGVTDLFYKTTSGSVDFPAEDPEDPEGSVKALFVNELVNVDKGESEDNKLIIENFDPNKNKLFITGKSGKGKEIGLIAPSDTSEEFSILKLFNVSIYKIEGQDEIKDVSVKYMEGKIRFTNDKGIEPPNITNGTGLNDFVSLMGVDSPYEGSTEVLAENKDKIVISSKEYGEGTDNITVNVYSNKFGEEERKSIEVYVDNILKETFKDISLDRMDIENRFDTVIGKSPENGGSNYIEIKIVEGSDKEEDEIKYVQIPDGIYKLGQPNKDGDRKRERSSEDAYDSYEYSVGNDGIPLDGGYPLFMNALAPRTSELSNKDLYNFHIIIAPDCHENMEVQQALIALCEYRGDAITIIDPPVGLDKQRVIDWHNGKDDKTGRNITIDSNYAAVYWPWCKIIDSSSPNKGMAWVMPSVVMAPKYVEVDKKRGPHTAPAGEVNGKLFVSDIECNTNVEDRDELYTGYNRINPITKFSDGNIVVYGEKTTQRSNSVLTKIHVRRMLVNIKKQCKNALRRYLFMPNTTDYLGKISNSVSSILESYKINGGVNFYKVVCDETNNSIETRQQDIINVDAVIVPEGTIEQININLTLNKSQETISTN